MAHLTVNRTPKVQLRHTAFEVVPAVDREARLALTRRKPRRREISQRFADRFDNSAIAMETKRIRLRFIRPVFAASARTQPKTNH